MKPIIATKNKSLCFIISIYLVDESKRHSNTLHNMCAYKIYWPTIVYRFKLIEIIKNNDEKIHTAVRMSMIPLDGSFETFALFCSHWNKNSLKQPANLFCFVLFSLFFFFVSCVNCFAKWIGFNCNLMDAFAFNDEVISEHNWIGFCCNFSLVHLHKHSHTAHMWWCIFRWSIKYWINLCLLTHKHSCFCSRYQFRIFTFRKMDSYSHWIVAIQFTQLNIQLKHLCTQFATFSASVLFGRCCCFQQHIISHWIHNKLLQRSWAVMKTDHFCSTRTFCQYLAVAWFLLSIRLQTFDAVVLFFQSTAVFICFHFLSVFTF